MPLSSPGCSSDLTENRGGEKGKLARRLSSVSAVLTLPPPTYEFLGRPLTQPLPSHIFSISSLTTSPCSALPAVSLRPRKTLALQNFQVHLLAVAIFQSLQICVFCCASEQKVEQYPSRRGAGAELQRLTLPCSFPHRTDAQLPSINCAPVPCKSFFFFPF